MREYKRIIISGFVGIIFLSFLIMTGRYLMKKNEIKNQLEEITDNRKIDEDEEIYKIAQPIINDHKELAETLMELLNNDNERTVYLTKRLINQLNYLLLPDFVYCDNTPEDIWGCLWFLNSLVDDELYLREDIFKKFFILLEDKRLIPSKMVAGPQAEEPMPKRRICDAAFFALKRLLNHPLGDNNDWGEKEGNIALELILEEKRFLDLNFSERDRVIKKHQENDYWHFLGFSD